MYNGILNIYKEKDYTSFDVVAKLRGILKQKKIGHTGTLDPLAEGVLVVCLGNATKLVDILVEAGKEYHTVMKLGICTDTDDITGNILSENLYEGLDDELVIHAIESFRGSYLQVPPMYSAIKKDGKKLYEYARAGAHVEVEPRPVTIYDISNIKVYLPFVSFDVKCSKGTYIRSLCKDIGEKLGCGGTLYELLRTEAKGFRIENAHKLNEIEEFRDMGMVSQYVIPTDEILREYDALYITDEYKHFLRNGNKLFMGSFAECKKYSDRDIVRVYLDKEFAALYMWVDSEQIFKPYKMFLNTEA